MTLLRYLENKPENWVVSALEAVELVTAKVPRLLVLEEQVAMIEAMNQLQEVTSGGTEKSG